MGAWYHGRHEPRRRAVAAADVDGRRADDPGHGAAMDGVGRAPLAAQAAASILSAGGSHRRWCRRRARLGVVHPDMVSFAGVAPIWSISATRGTFEVTGVGPYPQASADFYRTQCAGEIPPGVLRTVVPTSPDAWCTAPSAGDALLREVVGPALEVRRARLSALRLLRLSHRGQRRSLPALAVLRGCIFPAMRRPARHRFVRPSWRDDQADERPAQGARSQQAGAIRAA